MQSYVYVYATRKNKETTEEFSQRIFKSKIDSVLL